jgi:hypothetical protein
VFGPGATLQIELGGPAAGTQYDQINVAGELILGGTLEISLINGFMPTAGQTFDFLAASDVVGAFSSIVLPTLPGLTWNTSQLLSGVLSVTLPGDFDHDGDGDGRDFLPWQRGGSPSPFSASELADWQANYGSGMLVAASVAVPEPSALLVLTLSTFGNCRRRCRFV